VVVILLGIAGSIYAVVPWLQNDNPTTEETITTAVTLLGTLGFGYISGLIVKILKLKQDKL
jgi:hypothetical protein